MDCKAGAELRLEPCRFRRHDVAGVGNVGELFHRHGIKREGDSHLAAVHPALKLSEAAYAAYEVDALVRAEVLDAQDPVEHQFGKDGDVQHSYGVGIVVAAGLGGEGVPLAVEIHAEVVQAGGSRRFLRCARNDSEVFFEGR